MHKLKFTLGLFVSLVFLYLAFRSVDLERMAKALREGHYWYLLPATGALFLSHYFRSVRWRFFLAPLQRTDIKSLFSALIIGYMANVVTPAHLGEFLRSYVLSRKKRLPMESVFATIVVERIVDVVSLVLLLLFALWVYPFPTWVVNSGYIMLAIVLGLCLVLFLSKRFDARISSMLCRWLPGVIGEKIACSLDRFLSGIIPLRRKRDYIPVFILTGAIWACYGLSYYFALYIFDLNAQFDLPWFAALVILVITTISIVVPSSPGYVGTYHFLCQTSLLLFGVPAEVSLSYATIAHGINVLPVMALGFVFSAYEGIRIGRHSEEEYAAQKITGL
jgi:hypothetical protein